MIVGTVLCVVCGNESRADAGDSVQMNMNESGYQSAVAYRSARYLKSKYTACTTLSLRSAKLCKRAAGKELHKTQQRDEVAH